MATAAHHLGKVNRNVTLITWTPVAQLRDKRSERRQEFQDWEKKTCFYLSAPSYPSGTQVSIDVEKAELGSSGVFFPSSLSTSRDGLWPHCIFSLGPAASPLASAPGTGRRNWANETSLWNFCSRPHLMPPPTVGISGPGSELRTHTTFSWWVQLWLQTNPWNKTEERQGSLSARLLVLWL